MVLYCPILCASLRCCLAGSCITVVGRRSRIFLLVVKMSAPLMCVPYCCSAAKLIAPPLWVLHVRLCQEKELCACQKSIHVHVHVPVRLQIVFVCVMACARPCTRMRVSAQGGCRAHALGGCVCRCRQSFFVCRASNTTEAWALKLPRSGPCVQPA